MGAGRVRRPCCRPATRPEPALRAETLGARLRCRPIRIQHRYPDEPPPCRTPPGLRLWPSCRATDTHETGPTVNAMFPTVRDVLALAPVRLGAPKVVAGE